MINKKILIICLIAFTGNVLLAQDFKYIGAAKCKMCHNKPAKGEQYKKWTEASHSKAFETLKGDQAMAIAKEKGIADPSADPACLKCHSTASATDPGLHAGIKVEEGVSCESCHGPGSVYKNMTIMKSREKSMEKGLIIPDEKVCTQCHNSESPTFKSFDFKEHSAKIAHPNPMAGM